MAFQQHLFPGQIPRETYAQMEAILQMPERGEVFVFCSGSFRSEMWLTGWRPHLELHSCDISLLSCAIGRYLAHDPLPMVFVDRLAWLEDLVAEMGESPMSRLVAMFIGAECRRLLGDRQRARLDAYIPTARTMIDDIRTRVQKHVDKIKIARFVGRDMRDHADEALERGAVVLGFPPTYGTTTYRDMAQFKRFEASVRWEQPTFREWRADGAAAWLSDYRARGGRYVLGIEYPLPGHEPAAYYQTGRKAPVYVYTNLPTRRGSVLTGRSTRPEPVRYELVTEDDLVAGARVELLRIPQNTMAYLKDCFYKQGLVHSAADCNIVVLVNGRLAGGFSHRVQADAKFHAPAGQGASSTAYLLADFSVGLAHRRLAKLVALLATSREAVSYIERDKVLRIRHLRTTAYSDKPVSMKYRDVWELESRKPHLTGAGLPENQLNYTSEVRDEQPSVLFEYWLRRWGAPRRR